jgi:hypothetical protein
MTERITWDTCPQCGRYAAVGWLDGIPVGFDCPRGCQLTADQFARREPKVGDSLSASAGSAAGVKYSQASSDARSVQSGVG